MNAVVPAAQPKSVLVTMSDRFGMEPSAFEATVRATCMPVGRDAPQATREEFAAFLLVAKEYGLNPLTREIYAYPRKGGGIVPVVSIDGWVNLINSRRELDGIEFDIEHDQNRKLISITCRIHRKDRKLPVSVTEYLSECIRDTIPWKMQHRMLRHKALIQCARYAFGFAGIYDEDEAQRIVETVEVEIPSGPPPAPPIDLPDMRRATAAVIEHKPAAPVAPAPEQPAAQVPRAQAQAVVADPAAAACNSEDDRSIGAAILVEVQAHLDDARSATDVSDIRALYADDEEHLTRSERETFEHLFEEAEDRVGKPVEPVAAPEAAKTSAAAEAPQESAFEPWSDYEGRIRKLAQNTSTPDQAGGLRKVWKAGKDYRAIMEERKIATREQRVALTAVVQEAIKRAEAPPAETAPAATAVPGVTDQDSEAVRACGERIFSSLSTAPTKEKAFLIWSRSQRDRDECGASADVLAAWTKEYQAIRKRLPEEAA